MKLSAPKPADPKSRVASPHRLGMSLPRALLILGVAATASLALSLAIRSAEPSGADEPGAASDFGVQWAFRPDSPSDLASQATALVEVQVDQIRVGGELELEGANVPTELVDVHVTLALEGDTPSNLVIYKLGDQQVTADGDPPYEVGRRYVLFVEPRQNADGTGPNPDGSYLAVAPEGRLALDESNQAQPLIDSPVANELQGMTPDQIDQAVGDDVGEESGASAP
jgi:hypothetical protein